MSMIKIKAARKAVESKPGVAAGLAVVALAILGLAGVNPTFATGIAAVLCCVGASGERAAKLTRLEPALLPVRSQNRRARRRRNE